MMINPTAYLCIWVDATGRETWRQYHDESDPLPETWDDVPSRITKLYSSAQVKAHNEANETMLKWSAKQERERCADECERMVMYPGGRQESAAHNDVWQAAKAIRALGDE